MENFSNTTYLRKISVNTMSTTDVRSWTVHEYLQRYCDTTGKQIKPFRLDEFHNAMQQERQADAEAIKDICKE